MKVIWKRPDGFLSAEPADFRVADLSSGARIWLHQTDSENFPFRVSGGWSDETLTKKLNTLVNLLGQTNEKWTHTLTKLFHDSHAESPQAFIKDMKAWFADLKQNLKGDTWELEILTQTLIDVEAQVKMAYLTQSSPL